VILAAEMRQGLVRRLALVGLAVALALGANIVRVGILSLGVERWGEPITHGLPHLGIAWALWAIAVGILAAGAVLLQRGRRAC
jgi:exosortase/archaeosortase family protein